MDMTAADDAAGVLDATLRALPDRERGPLVAAPGTTAVPFSAVTDAAWLDEQVRSRARRWGTDDRRVLATLWWYSATVWFQAPAVASLLVTRRVLSPHLSDVTAHLLPDGLITGATSSALLDAPPTGGLELAAADDAGAEVLGHALHEVLAEVVPLVAAVGRMRQRPLWAIASDSTANRFLWAGRALQDVDRASALAARVAERTGPPLPRPRWVDVVPMDGDCVDRPDLGLQRFTRRSSCCLIYEVPGQGKCGSCPRRTPDDRLLRMRYAASVQALEP